jgi:carboxymethylenebutenolidase
MVKLAVFAGGTAAALALLPYLENNYALATMVPENDGRIRTTSITFPGTRGELRAYLAEPKDAAKIPAVLVIHEVYGLNPHIEDVTRRLGVEGFLAMAPDALTPVGGTPEDADKARSMVRQLDEQTTVKNYLAALKYLQTHPRSNGNAGVVGFCWGGGMANQLAVQSPELKAAVPFYGMQPAPEDVPRIKASLLLHYAGLDERINKGIPAFEAALKQAGIDYQIFMYEGANHAFHNDTNAARYNEGAAQLAWNRTIAFFKEKLKT